MTVLSDPTLSNIARPLTCNLIDAGAHLADDPEILERMLSGAACVVICYDVTLYESFVAATSDIYRKCKALVPAAAVFLIGCKADLPDRRRVAISDGERFAEKNNVFFMETSAADGSNFELTLTIMRIRLKPLVDRNPHLLLSPSPTRPATIPTNGGRSAGTTADGQANSPATIGANRAFRRSMADAAQTSHSAVDVVPREQQQHAELNGESDDEYGAGDDDDNGAFAALNDILRRGRASAAPSRMQSPQAAPQQQQPRAVSLSEQLSSLHSLYGQLQAVAASAPSSPAQQQQHSYYGGRDAHQHRHDNEDADISGHEQRLQQQQMSMSNPMRMASSLSASPSPGFNSSNSIRAGYEIGRSPNFGSPSARQHPRQLAASATGITYDVVSPSARHHSPAGNVALQVLHELTSPDGFAAGDDGDGSGNDDTSAGDFGGGRVPQQQYSNSLSLQHNLYQPSAAQVVAVSRMADITRRNSITSSSVSHQQQMHRLQPQHLEQQHSQLRGGVSLSSGAVTTAANYSRRGSVGGASVASGSASTVPPPPPEVSHRPQLGSGVAQAAMMQPPAPASQQQHWAVGSVSVPQRRELRQRSDSYASTTSLPQPANLQMKASTTGDGAAAALPNLNRPMLAAGGPGASSSLHHQPQSSLSLHQAQQQQHAGGASSTAEQPVVRAISMSDLRSPEPMSMTLQHVNRADVAAQPQHQQQSLLQGVAQQLWPPVLPMTNAAGLNGQQGMPFPFPFAFPPFSMPQGSADPSTTATSMPPFNGQWPFPFPLLPFALPPGTATTAGSGPAPVQMPAMPPLPPQLWQQFQQHFQQHFQWPHGMPLPWPMPQTQSAAASGAGETEAVPAASAVAAAASTNPSTGAAPAVTQPQQQQPTQPVVAVDVNAKVRFVDDPTATSTGASDASAAAATDAGDGTDGDRNTPQSQQTPILTSAAGLSGQAGARSALQQQEPGIIASSTTGTANPGTAGGALPASSSATGPSSTVMVRPVQLPRPSRLSLIASSSAKSDPHRIVARLLVVEVGSPDGSAASARQQALETNLGTIDVRLSDAVVTNNNSFSLANRFVMKHGLDVSHVVRIAKAVQMHASEVMQEEERIRNGSIHASSSSSGGGAGYAGAAGGSRALSRSKSRIRAGSRSRTGEAASSMLSASHAHDTTNGNAFERSASFVPEHQAMADASAAGASSRDAVVVTAEDAVRVLTMNPAESKLSQHAHQRRNSGHSHLDAPGTSVGGLNISSVDGVVGATSGAALDGPGHQLSQHSSNAPGPATTRRGPVVGKLHVQVSPSLSATLALRAGDDPKGLVESFARAFAITDRDAKQMLMKTVSEHLAASAAAAAAREQQDRAAAAAAVALLSQQQQQSRSVPGASSGSSVITETTPTAMRSSMSSSAAAGAVSPRNSRGRGLVISVINEDTAAASANSAAAVPQANAPPPTDQSQQQHMQLSIRQRRVQRGRSGLGTSTQSSARLHQQQNTARSVSRGRQELLSAASLEATGTMNRSSRRSLSRGSANDGGRASDGGLIGSSSLRSSSRGRALASPAPPPASTSAAVAAARGLDDARRRFESQALQRAAADAAKAFALRGSRAVMGNGGALISTTTGGNTATGGVGVAASASRRSSIVIVQSNEHASGSRRTSVATDATRSSSVVQTATTGRAVVDVDVDAGISSAVASRPQRSHHRRADSIDIDGDDGDDGGTPRATADQPAPVHVAGIAMTATVRSAASAGLAGTRLLTSPLVSPTSLASPGLAFSPDFASPTGAAGYSHHQDHDGNPYARQYHGGQPQPPSNGLTAVPLDQLTLAQRRLLEATLTGTPVSSGRKPAAAGRGDDNDADGDFAGAKPQALNFQQQQQGQTPRQVLTQTQLQSLYGQSLPPAPPPPPPTSKPTSRKASVSSMAASSAGATQSASSANGGAVRQPDFGAAAQPAAAGAKSPNAGVPAAAGVVTGYQGKAPGKPMFNLDVDIGNGRKGRIVVCAGARVEDMAAEFVSVHKLNPTVVMPRLSALISQSIRAQQAKTAAAAAAKQAY